MSRRSSHGDSGSATSLPLPLSPTPSPTDLTFELELSRSRGLPTDLGRRGESPAIRGTGRGEWTAESEEVCGKCQNQPRYQWCPPHDPCDTGGPPCYYPGYPCANPHDRPLDTNHRPLLCPLLSDESLLGHLLFCHRTHPRRHCRCTSRSTPGPEVDGGTRFTPGSGGPDGRSTRGWVLSVRPLWRGLRASPVVESDGAREG